jgi:FtsK/SpoIIIE family
MVLLSPNLKTLARNFIRVAGPTVSAAEQQVLFSDVVTQNNLDQKSQVALIEAIDRERQVIAAKATPGPLGDDAAITNELTDESHLMGRVISQVASEFGVPISYCPDASRRSLRLRRLRFRPKGPNCNVTKLETQRDNFIVHAGLDSDFLSLPVPGFLEFQVPLPPSEWQTVGFKSFLKGHQSKFFRGGALVGQESPPKDGFSYIAGSDLDGNPLEVNDVVGMLITGIKGSGKSDHLLSLLIQLMIQYRPTHYKFFLVDAPGATFFALEDSTWNWCPPVIGDYPELFSERINAVRTEARRREALFRENQVKCIEGWNAKYPRSPLCRIGVVVEEFEETCDRFGSELVNSTLASISRANRKQGIDVIIATQVAKKGLFDPGLINNLGDRVSFKTADRYASEMAMGAPGAERLLGKGDGFLKTGSTPTRFQSLYIGNDADSLKLIQTILQKGRESYGDFDYGEYLAIIVDNTQDQGKAQWELWMETRNSEMTQHEALEYVFGPFTKGRQTQRHLDTIADLERRFGQPT